MTRTAHVISEGRILQGGDSVPFSVDQDGVVIGPSQDDVNNNRVLRADNTFVDQTAGGDVASPGPGSTSVHELFKSANTNGTQLAVTGLLSTVFSALDFTPQTGPGWAEGRLYYDSDEDALSYYNDQSNVTINLGQEVVLKARNESGSTILNGAAVRISGVSAGLPTVVLAQADSQANAQTVGIATHNISNNSTGYITGLGKVGDVNTTSWSAGDTLYLSDSTPGALTNVEPAISVPMARALDSTTLGKIYVGGFPNDVHSHTASEIPFTPYGNIVASDVQNAIEELDDEKQPAGNYQPEGAVTGVNLQTGTSYTLELTDAGGLVELSNASAVTLTVPTNASVAFPIGTIIHMAQGAAGQVTIGGAGVTILTAATFTAQSLEQEALMTLIKTGTDTWRLGGMLAAA